MLTNGVVLLQDNARPHTAARTNALIKLFNWEIFDHPPYSPDVMPGDYHLFTKMKVWLATQRFHTNEELMDGVKNWLHNLAAPFFDEGLQNLVLRYKCLAGPKKPKLKSTAATKPATDKTKKKAAASAKTAAAKPTTPDMVVPTQFSNSPLEDFYDLLDRHPIQACVELTRRLLTSISSLPTGAARPRAVLKTVIFFVAEYGSTP
jgi:hypothetical protein